MNPYQVIGKFLLVFGLVTILLGLIFTFGGRIPWLGKLPGDIIINKKGFHFYFPLTTCILLSLVLTLIIWLFSRK